MHGARDAPMNWQAEYSQVLIDNGFDQGVATPCAFHRSGRGIRTLVHGDLYVSVGGPEQLHWMRKMLEKKYQSKTQVLGPREGDTQQLEVLNRMVAFDWAQAVEKFHADLVRCRGCACFDGCVVSPCCEFRVFVCVFKHV